MNKIKYGVGYPFYHTSQGNFNPLQNQQYIRSKLLYLLNVRKGQIPFNPRFGIDLYPFLFQNHLKTKFYSNIKQHIKNQIKLFISQITIQNINVYQPQNKQHSLLISINYYIDQKIFTTKVEYQLDE